MSRNYSSPITKDDHENTPLHNFPSNNNITTPPPRNKPDPPKYNIDNYDDIENRGSRAGSKSILPIQKFIDNVPTSRTSITPGGPPLPPLKRRTSTMKTAKGKPF
eukprot:UN32962